MKIAVPVEGESIAESFENCQGLKIFQVEYEDKTFSQRQVVALPSADESLTDYLRSLGVAALLVKRISMQNYHELRSAYIFVAPGIDNRLPEEAVRHHLQGSLQCCMYR